MYLFIIFLFIAVAYCLLHYRSFDVKIQPLSKDKTLPAKGTLAVLVILGHLNKTLNYPPLELFGVAGIVAVGCFFLMSAYGLSFSLEKKGRKYLDGFFKHRLRKILIPYVIVILVWNIEEQMLYPDQKIFESWFLITQGITQAILPHSWFILVLILFYVVFYISHKYFNGYVRSSVLILSFIAYFVTMRFVLGWTPYWYLSSCMFFLGFLYYKKEHLITKCNVFIWLAAMFIMSLTIKGHCDYTDMMFNSVFSLSIICFITIFEHNNRFLAFLGSISYELYIVQGLPQFALANVDLPANASLIIILVSDVILAYGLHRLVETLNQKTC